MNSATRKIRITSKSENYNLVPRRKKLPDESKLRD
ncbi:hypothetical protein J2X69_005142 [Algoriphagus sp. 4150]|nr:hypothetical protein [Algoriphagus sp. 4150]